MNSGAESRTVRIFRYDPASDGSGRFEAYSLRIEKPDITTILDVLLRIQKEQDPSLAFRFACRVNMCGSCGMVINGREGLACKTNVSDLPAKQDITLRPLNHFRVIKDLVVDMDPFFAKYADVLPFFEPKEQHAEPYIIKPDTRERMDIGMATDCIACGCCVSACTMVDNHENYAGPAALNRAFTLLADKRDGLFLPRLARALDSCAHCRTEFNCTEVCPKKISATYAIKYIQRIGVKHLRDIRPSSPPAEETKAADIPPCRCEAELSRRSFLKSATGIVSAGTVLSLTTILGVASVAPTLRDRERLMVDAGRADAFPVGEIRETMLRFEHRRDFHTEKVTRPVLVRRLNERDFICFDSSCPHLGCSVSWDKAQRRFTCACHGGAFDVEGKVLAGPPPRPLERLNWEIKDGILRVEVV